MANPSVALATNRLIVLSRSYLVGFVGASRSSFGALKAALSACVFPRAVVEVLSRFLGVRHRKLGTWEFAGCLSMPPGENVVCLSSLVHPPLVDMSSENNLAPCPRSPPGKASCRPDVLCPHLY